MTFSNRTPIESLLDHLRNCRQFYGSVQFGVSHQNDEMPKGHWTGHGPLNHWAM